MGLERQNEVPVPPRLTMDEYVEFVEASMQLVDPEKVRRQKELEENIQVMFSLRDSHIPEFEHSRISPPTLEL